MRHVAALCRAAVGGAVTCTWRAGCAVALLLCTAARVASAQVTYNVTTCSESCTVTHVLSLENLPVLNLDAAGGAAIAGAILAVWAVAWGFRTVIRTLNSTDGSQPSESE
jgi:hypothetical protein